MRAMVQHGGWAGQLLRGSGQSLAVSTHITTSTSYPLTQPQSVFALSVPCPLLRGLLPPGPSSRDILELLECGRESVMSWGRQCVPSPHLTNICWRRG